MNDTRPDLDDGWLPIAHELLAVIAVAGFNKWEMVVLREVFDQVFGFDKPKTATARVSPSFVANRLGTVKQTIVRAVRTLVKAGVLARVAECEYRFVKDYGTWRHGDGARFTPKEIAYCASAKRTNKEVKSKRQGNNGASRLESLPLFDSLVDTSVTQESVGNNAVSLMEAPALPGGSATVSPGKRHGFPGEAPRFPGISIPLEPPIGEPARQDKGTREKEIHPPNPPRGGKSGSSDFILPDWVPADDWDAFVEMRKSNGHRLTDRAKRIAVKRLERFRARGIDPAEILQEAVLRCWRGLFDPNESRTSNAPAGRRNPDPPTPPIVRAGDPRR